LAQAAPTCVPPYAIANTAGISLKTDCGIAAHQLTINNEYTDSEPALSPQGDRLAFTRMFSDGTSDIFIGAITPTTDLTTFAPTQVSHLGSVRTPSWSPDGTELVVSAVSSELQNARGIYKVNASSGNAALLTTLSGTDPAWCHNGQVVLVHTDGANQDIYALSGTDGSGAARVATGLGANVFNLACSPDSHYVFYDHALSTTSQPSYVFAVPMVGGQPVQLTTGGTEHHPSVAGDWTMVYVKTGTTPHEIDLRWLGGTTVTVAQSTSDSDDQPSFQPGDGTVPAPAAFAALFSGSSPPPPPPVSKSAAFLGDSYSAGEGAPAIVNGKPQYLPGTDQSDNRCHRSAAAYGPLLGGTLDSSYRTRFHACSGAIIADFYKSYGANHKDLFGNPKNPAEIAQLDWLTKDTKLVTLTIGGNDIGFPDVMTYCVLRNIGNSTCENLYGKLVKQKINEVRSSKSLQKLYRDIKSRVASDAKIMVLSYPRFFPVHPPITCFSGGPGLFVDSDMLWINKMAREFDDVIKKAASDAGVTYVEAYDMLNGHELCTRDPWINRVIVDVHPSATAGSIHPKVRGQQAYFEAAKSHLN
jgi:lysophospholipase L1-like esterase